MDQKVNFDATSKSIAHASSVADKVKSLAPGGYAIPATTADHVSSVVESLKASPVVGSATLAANVATTTSVANRLKLMNPTGVVTSAITGIDMPQILALSKFAKAKKVADALTRVSTTQEVD